MEHELTGCYPIILDGAESGKVTVSREGLFWRFEASCGMREELLRLSVYGEGAEGYLGVMEPVDGSLRLSKKFSRNSLSSFPKTISYATRAGEASPRLAIHEEHEEMPQGEAPAAPSQQETDSLPPQSGDEKSSAATEDNEDDGNSDLPAEDDKPPPEVVLAAQGLGTERVWRYCPMPCSLFSDLWAKSVCSKISGALMLNNEEGIILAVPEKTALAMPENRVLIFTETEIIAGRRYSLAAIKYK